MTHYLLSVHTPVGAPQAPMTDEQMREGYARISAVEDELKTAGALVFSGRLEDPATASVVRATNGAAALTTDGPFIEAKEAIAGFYIIQAASPDAAREWASKTSAATGMPIEVRPFLDSHGA
jgi:hypothetical protein